MIYLFTILLGIIQGLTEFLPVSSSGHLVLLHEIWVMPQINNLIFDVVLHTGTLVALLVYFYKDIISYLRAFLNSLVNWNIKNDLQQRMAWLIIISIIPAGIIGYFFEDIIENVFRSALSVALVLIAVSFLFFLAEKYTKKEKNFQSLTWWKVLLIGIAQAIALIPGVSRSGITIITGMYFNLKRELAARLSFLISIPIIFIASLKKGYDLFQAGLVAEELVIYLLGFLVSAFTGYFCIKYFLQFLKKY
ncbi:undecaprenyl-diphosphatase UppP, partial [Patescibacteria group bacterium]